MATNEPYNPFRNQAPVAVPPPQPTGGNGLAIAGMVVGIVGLVMFFMPVGGPVVSLVGLILSLVGLRHAATVGGRGKGMAIAGIACAACGLLIGLFVTIVVLRDFDDRRRSKRFDSEVQTLRVQTRERSYVSSRSGSPSGSGCAMPASKSIQIRRSLRQS